MNKTIPAIELNDIQGLIGYSYPYLPEAQYVLLHFHQQLQASAFIGQIIPKIVTANMRPDMVAWQIAFTNHGIFKWFPAKELTQPFSPEFTDGMTDGNRRRILGDMDTNDPLHWEWGNESAGHIHAVVMLYAKDTALLKQERVLLDNICLQHATTVVKTLETITFSPFEHFGFSDGITNPEIIGFPPKKGPHSNDHVMPGEFILGYPNEYGKYPFSPQIDGWDIGSNGSYMVLRQLEQDVKGFWQFMKNTRQNYELLAAKMVGRHRDGTPLTPYSTQDHEDKQAPKDKNAFYYRAEDIDGKHCPVGAHIRKTNPRDGIDDNSDISLDVVSKHRIVRRGRSYGTPLSPDYEPEEMLASAVEGKRGLFFIGFNAQLKRQFEFIQSAWCNNNKFDGLYNDLDPLIGFPIRNRKYKSGEFTIPACPFREKIPDIPQFVFMKGGAYFFMPGLRTLRRMAEAQKIPTGLY